jgi:hypothetical protein
VKRPILPVVAVLAVGAAAYAGYRSLWPTQEDLVRRTLTDLASAASVPAQEGDLQRLVRVQRIREYLVEDVLVEVEGGPVMSGREAIVGALIQVSVRGPVLVRFEDVSLRMAPDERAAAVTATVAVEQPDPPSGAAGVDAREVEMTWVRPESSWVLSRARAVRPLR